MNTNLEQRTHLVGSVFLFYFLKGHLSFSIANQISMPSFMTLNNSCVNMNIPACSHLNKCIFIL